MPEEVEYVSIDALESFMVDVFVNVGVPKLDAKVCADVLISADKQGIDSHGVSRLKPIYYDRIMAGLQSPVTNFEIIRESPTTAVVDGHGGMGMVIGKKAMQLAIDKAKKLGMGMVAVRNSTHYGIAGYYANWRLSRGSSGSQALMPAPVLLLLSVSRTCSALIPSHSVCLAMNHFLSCLTALQALFNAAKLRSTRDRERNSHLDSSSVKSGESKTDPNEILSDLLKGEAALLPLGGLEETGGYKGYGYATVVEILSAALQGGAFLKALTGVNLGHFFIAIDVSAFTELDEFRRITGDILRGLRSSRKMPGKQRIYTAGEKEYLTMLERKHRGIPINKSLQLEINQLKKELNLTEHRFAF